MPPRGGNGTFSPAKRPSLASSVWPDTSPPLQVAADAHVGGAPPPLDNFQIQTRFIVVLGGATGNGRRVLGALRASVESYHKKVGRREHGAQQLAARAFFFYSSPNQRSI